MHTQTVRKQLGINMSVVTATTHSLGPSGDDFLKAFTEDWYRAFMRDWERALNHFLRTGRKIDA